MNCKFNHWKLFAFGLLTLAVAFLLGIPLLSAGGASLAIVAGVKINMDGLEGEGKKFMEDFKARVTGVEFDGMTKAEIVKLVTDELKATQEANKAFAGIKAEDIAKLLDAEKGVYAILKNMGIEITTLKESGKDGKKTGKTLKALLMEAMPEIEKVFRKRSGEHVVDIEKAAIMTTANTVDYTDLPDDVLDSFTIGNFVEKRRPREYVFDLANVSTVAEVEKYIVWEEEGAESGAFAIVAEGAIKPLVSLALVKNHSEAKKIAGKYVVTEEFTKWRKKAYAIIQRLIQQKMLRDYAAVLTTALLADAAPYVASALDGQYPADKVTDYHAIAAVAAQIEAIDFVPDMLILNPQDKWRIGMSQDVNGQFYLSIPLVNPQGQTTILGFTVRTSNRVPVGNFILGESGLWEIVQESLKIRTGYGITVTGGTENGGGNVTNVSGDLDNNRFRVIVEMYFHTYIATNNAGSFVYANFDVVKELVTAA